MLLIFKVIQENVKIQEEIKCMLHSSSGNVCYYSIQNLLFSFSYRETEIET
jgi:hypothetical protein